MFQEMCWRAARTEKQNTGSEGPSSHAREQWEQLRIRRLVLTCRKVTPVVCDCRGVGMRREKQESGGSFFPLPTSKTHASICCPWRQSNPVHLETLGFYKENKHLNRVKQLLLLETANRLQETKHKVLNQE